MMMKYTFFFSSHDEINITFIPQIDHSFKYMYFRLVCMMSHWAASSEMLTADMKIPMTFHWSRAKEKYDPLKQG